MIEDEVNKKLGSFYVTPVNRIIFVLGYLLAAIIVAFIICLLTVLIGEGYIAITGAEFLSFEQHLKIIIFIILNVFSSSCLVFFILNFVHTQGALSGLGTIIGTLVGFMAAIYLPMGMLPQKVQLVLKCFPLVYGSSFLREILTSQMITKTFTNCPKEVIDGYKEYMGISLTYHGSVIGDGFKIAFLVISGIILIGISAALQRRRNVMRR